MKVIAKYPIKIGNTTVPQGTVGIIATLDEVKKRFPNIEYNPKSVQIPVKFLDLDACIIHKNQLLFT